jgi:ubiquinone/menaquinone biosynthesis C-methylase UbiE
MENRNAYVQLRVNRLTYEDLHRKPNKWISQMPQCRSARRVLDIACGLGCESIAWTRAGKQVVGIDFNFDLLKAAKGVAKGQGLPVDYVVADATRLPFRDSSFEIASSEALLEHVPNWQAIGSEALRVLGPDGVFFVSTINRHCPINPEITHLHFYPWLPQSLKAPILRWVMRNKPAWVGYTKFPAINWFTHRGLAHYLRGLGFTTYEVFDMARRETTGPSKRKFFFLIQLVKQVRILRYFAYPLMGMVHILAVKQKVQPTPAVERSSEPAFAK